MLRMTEKTSSPLAFARDAEKDKAADELFRLLAFIMVSIGRGKIPDLEIATRATAVSTDVEVEPLSARIARVLKAAQDAGVGAGIDTGVKP